MLNSLSKINTVAYYTAKEVIKSKVLYNIFFLGIGLLLVTFVAYSFTYGEPSRVSLDFGLGMLNLSSVGIAIFMGVGLLTNEIENRTVYMIISRPVPRYCFILGRIAGLVSVLLINIFMLSFITLSLYFFIGGEFQPLILWCIFFICLESILILIIVSFFSLITSPTLATVLTIVLYIVGNGINESKLTVFVEKRPLIRIIIEAYHYVLPGFYKLNLKDFVLYKQNIDMSFIGGNAIYAILYSTSLLIISIFIFNRKNLD